MSRTRPVLPAATVAKPAAARAAITFTLPVAVLERIDALAQREERPRSKIIEYACRKYVEDAAA